MSVSQAPPLGAPALAAQLNREGANVVAIRIGEKAPAHAWKRWQHERQSQQDVLTLPWPLADRAGIINGIGGIRSFDFDGCPSTGPLASLLAALGLPADYSWCERSGSGKGFHVWLVCDDEIPPGVFTSKGNEPGVFVGESVDGSFHHLELRWERNQTIVASSDGHDRWLYGPPTEPPMRVTMGSVINGFFTVARKEQPLAPTTASVPPQHQDDRAAVEAVKERFDLAAYAAMRFLGEVQVEPDGQLRVLGNGGLLIDPHRKVWYRFTGDVGGDGIDLVGVAMHGDAWDNRDREMFPEALREAAAFAGVNLADYRRAPAPPRAPIPIRTDFGDMPPGESLPEGEESAPRSSRALTDYGNAERLVDAHGPDLRFCHPFKKWLAYDGTRWAIDQTAEVLRRAKATVRGIYKEAAHAATDGEAKELGKHAIKSEGDARIRAMVGLAQSEPGVPILPDALDADPWKLNLLNGTIDLRTGAIQPPARADMITKLAPVAFDPIATCPVFMRFLERILPSEGLRAFVQRAAGYSLTGDTREDVLFINFGGGNNGKSTLMETLLAMMGDYGMQTPTDTLLIKRDEGIPNDVARLKGARFVGAAEAEEGRRLAESRIKQMTGGDRLVARFLHGEYFEFAPEYKLWLSTNHKPIIRGTDNGIWRRIRLVPFLVTIPEGERDEALADKLLAELPGILNWALAGCLAWQRDGLGIADEVREATSAYRTEMDTLGNWLDECCIICEGISASAKSLYMSYQQWCEASGERVLPQRTFGMRLSERGYHNHRKPSGYWWLGIGLRLPLTDEPMHERMNEDEPISGISAREGKTNIEMANLGSSSFIRSSDPSSPRDDDGWESELVR